MLQVLQCFTGTSIAAAPVSVDLIRVQSLVGGPRRKGSSLLSRGGKW